MPSIVDESPSQDPNPQLISPSTYGFTSQPSPGQQLASPHRYEYEFGVPSSALSQSNVHQWNVEQQTPDQALFGSPLAQYASPFDGYGGYDLTSDFSGGLTGVSSSPLLTSSFAASGLPFRGLDYIRNYNPGGFGAGDQDSLWQSYDPGALAMTQSCLSASAHPLLLFYHQLLRPLALGFPSADLTISKITILVGLRQTIKIHYGKATIQALLAMTQSYLSASAKPLTTCMMVFINYFFGCIYIPDTCFLVICSFFSLIPCNRAINVVIL